MDLGIEKRPLDVLIGDIPQLDDPGSGGTKMNLAVRQYQAVLDRESSGFCYKRAVVKATIGERVTIQMHSFVFVVAILNIWCESAQQSAPPVGGRACVRLAH